MVKLGDILDSGTDFFDIDGNVTAPIFNAGANKANLGAQKEAYEQSLVSCIDVLDAQRQLFDAELSVTQSRRDRLQALASLYRALGEGWDVASVVVL